MSKNIAKRCEDCDFTIVIGWTDDWKFCPQCGKKLEEKYDYYD
ncbi:hypothetical protein [Nitrosopumilus sp.]